MKKLLLFLVLIVTINVSAQSTTWFSKPLELETVPASTSKSDSVLVRGTDKIVKYLPISKIKSITNLDYLATPTGGTVFSSSGNDASVPLATTVNAGLQSPADKSKINGLDLALANKVDKVAGKGLSTEDYTTVEKNKLAAVQNGATANSTDAQLRDRSTHTGTQAISTVISLQAALDAKINLSLVGANNGVAPLDAGGKIPFTYLPASLMIYKGMWNATTNTPTLSDATGVVGWVYKVNVGGTINLGSGNITFVVADFLIHNGTKWERSAGTDAVVSVNGQQGIVTLNKNDIGLGSVDNTSDLNKPISTATQTALNLKANLAGGNTFTGNNSFHLGTVSVAEPTLSHNPTTRNYVDSNFQLKISNPITGTGNTKYFPVFNGTSTVMSSSMFEESNRVAISAKPLLVTAGYGIGFQLEDGFKITREIGHTAFFYDNIKKMELSTNGLKLPYLAGGGIRVVTTDSHGTISASSSFLSVAENAIENRLLKNKTNGVAGSSQVFDDGLLVGVGTDSPNYNLHINAITPNNYIQMTNVATGTTASDGLLIGVNSVRGADFYQREDNYMRFFTNNLERFRIHGSGGFSIGSTNDPLAGNLSVVGKTLSKDLEVSNFLAIKGALSSFPTSGNGLEFWNPNATTSLIQSYNRASLAYNEISIRGSSVSFMTNAVERAKIHTSGGVSIGTPTDAGAGNLLVAGTTSSVAGFQVTSPVANSRNRLVSFGGGSDVTGLSYFAGTSGLNGKSSYGLHFTNATSAGSLFNFGIDGKFTATGTATAAPATLPTELVTKSQLDAVSATSGTFTPSAPGVTFSLCYWTLIGKVVSITYNFSYAAPGGSSVILSLSYPAGITDANIINNSIRGSGTLGISATNKFGISLASNGLNHCLLLQTGTLAVGTYTGSGTITFLIP